MKWLKGIFPLLLILVETLAYDVNEMMTFDIPHPIYKESLIKINEEASDWRGMIVPHHLLPFDKIKASYEKASSKKVKHVLLLSPDHFATSNRQVLTSTYDWTGYFGWLQSNQGLTRRFEGLDFVFDDPKEIEMEHGLNSHMPLIKAYFPMADVTCLAVSNRVTKEQVLEMMALIPKDTFVIGSVDFSHDYPLLDANKFDETTENLLLSHKYDDFFGMSDAYFDSPGVLYLLTTWAKGHDYRLNIEFNCNSADYFGYNLRETTSYFFISFREEKK